MSGSDTPLQIVGLVRFSVLTPTYYSERFATLEDTAAHLFSAERMELRFHIFENLCLRSLIKQHDQDFDVVILTAKSMPRPYLERLQDLLRPHPNLHCRPVGTQNHYRLLRKAYESVPTRGGSHRVLFRLDDDDALDMDYVARTRRFAQTLLTLQPEDSAFVIAHNRGFYLRATPEGPEVFDATEQTPLSVGTALVAPIDHSANPYRFNHRKLARHYSLYSDISVPGYIRTIHGDNKSTPFQNGLVRQMDDIAIDQSLQHHFDLTLDELKDL